MVNTQKKIGKVLISNHKGLNPMVGVEDVYLERMIGRSVLANPFVLMTQDPEDRQMVIEAFRLYFNGVLTITPDDKRYDLQINFMKLAKDMTDRLQPKKSFRLARMGITTPKLIQESLNVLESKLKAGQDLRFVCWCDPLPCHTGVIRDYLLKRISDRRH